VAYQSGASAAESTLPLDAPGQTGGAVEPQSQADDFDEALEPMFYKKVMTSDGQVHFIGVRV